MTPLIESLLLVKGFTDRSPRCSTNKRWDMNIAKTTRGFEVEFTYDLSWSIFSTKEQLIDSFIFDDFDDE